MTIYLDSLEVCRRLTAACKAAGGQRAFARKHSMSDGYVCDVLNGRRDPGPSILKALGLVIVIRYKVKTNKDMNDG